MSVSGYTYRDGMTPEQIWTLGPPVRDPAVLKEQAEAPLPPEDQERLLHDERARREARIRSGRVDPVEGLDVAEHTDPLAREYVVQAEARRRQQEIMEVLDSPLLMAAVRASHALVRARNWTKPYLVRAQGHWQTWRSQR